MRRPQLIVFAKWPEPGRVKTRMAAKIGDQAAAVRYREMVEQVVVQTAPRNGFERVLYFDPPEAAPQFRTWLHTINHQRPQSRGDLGARMSHAFRECLADGPRRTCIIGTDCLEVDTTLLEHAFAALDQHDAVIGPAKDGGYYLLGLKAHTPALFTDIPWSTGEVYRITCDRLTQLGWSYATLPTLADIDHA